MASEKVYTWDEVEQHNSKSAGVWLVIEDGVYDVTQWLEEHPGGEDVLLDNSGQDATNAFMAIGHSEGAIQKRETYRIGGISQFKEPPPPLQSVQTTTFQSWVNFVAGGLVPTLAVAIGVYLVYRHYKK